MPGRLSNQPAVMLCVVWTAAVFRCIGTWDNVYLKKSNKVRSVPTMVLT